MFVVGVVDTDRPVVGTQSGTSDRWGRHFGVFVEEHVLFLDSRKPQIPSSVFTTPDDLRHTPSRLFPLPSRSPHSTEACASSPS